MIDSSGLSEGDYFAVIGGLLEQSTFGVGAGNFSYLFPDATLTSGGLDPALITVVEARLSISQLEGTAGAYFQTFDGTNRYSVFFTAGGANILSSSGETFVAIADPSAFHTYRLESPGNSDVVRFFVDGALQVTVEAAGSALNGFGFGDGVTAAGNNADASWDFIRVSQDAPAVPSLSALGLGALALSLAAGAAGWMLRIRRR